MSESGSVLEEKGSQAAPADSAGTGGGRKVKRTLTVIGLTAAALILAAALIFGIMLIADRADDAALGMAKALAEGDGQAAVKLLPGEVIRQVASETGVSEDEAAGDLAESLGASVGVYAPPPSNAAFEAGETRLLTGGELQSVAELYGEIGLEVKKAAVVDVRISSDGASGAVPVRVVKLGLWWYADYTGAEDTAYRIAYLGK